MSSYKARNSSERGTIIAINVRSLSLKCPCPTKLTTLSLCFRTHRRQDDENHWSAEARLVRTSSARRNGIRVLVVLRRASFFSRTTRSQRMRSISALAPTAPRFFEDGWTNDCTRRRNRPTYGFSERRRSIRCRNVIGTTRTV